jgi:hypothetical protein
MTERSGKQPRGDRFRQAAGRTLGLLLALWLTPFAGFASEPDTKLHINPFVPPQTAAAGGGVKSGGGNDSMELRGVVLAGPHSLANIGGKIVGIGEEINGYRLMAVNEDRVVLDNNGVQREIRVRPLAGVGEDAKTSGTW